MTRNRPRNQPLTKEYILSRVFAETNTGCWLWEGTASNSGYGTVSVGRKSRSVHRVSWELFNGEIPDGLHVLHKCDTRTCCNPAHLFLGTPLDNMKDMVAKGRGKVAKGSDVVNSKLTNAAVMDIYRDDRPLLTVAGEYNVSISLVSAIRLGKRWAWLTSGVN